MIQGIGYSNIANSYSRIQYPRQNEEALKNLSGQNDKQEKAGQAGVQETAKPQMMDLKLDLIKPRTSLSVEDISLSLSQPSPFELKGRESSIENLDLTKAVSDMQKDEALQQYQYFVGSEAPIFQSEDGLVVAKPSM